jgi:tetratricopeptide (TPR) repeat protein
MFKYFFNALEIYENTGSADQVLDHASKIEDQSDRESTLSKLTKYFARTGNLEASRRFLSAIRADLNRVRCLYEVAQLLKKKNQIEHGRAFLQQAFQEASNLEDKNWGTAEILLSLSSVSHDFGDEGEATKLLNRAIAIGLADSGPGGSKLLFGCAMQLKKWNRPEDARALAEKTKDGWILKGMLGLLKD